ncbi:MAG: inositol monophosphatase [SAR202 cluster bacterium]|nr:inositol monophosphatase [SAR202 cluster bacterium]|tara:strand:+ start:14165 stop:15124 length:960 start_codon:yes stop_codon:yes gene_type:complete
MSNEQRLDENNGSIDDSEFQILEQFAIRLAKESGAKLLDHFLKPIEVEYKTGGDRDPVTIADKESEDFIRAQILKEYPDHAIIGEEGENHGSDAARFAWVIDPLDGTSNFINHIPIWACSIGLLLHGKPVVAAIYLPPTQETEGRVVHARYGGGAFIDGEAITVASNPTPNRGRLTIFPAYYWRMYKFRSPLRGGVGTIRSLGSTAFEMAGVASGMFQYGIFNPPSIWDIGAGILLVQEAGGVVMSLRRRRGPWQHLQSIVGKSGNVPTLKEIQGWREPVLAGNPRIAQFIAKNTTQRPRYLMRLRRYWAERKSRSATK